MAFECALVLVRYLTINYQLLWCVTLLLRRRYALAFAKRLEEKPALCAYAIAAHRTGGSLPFVCDKTTHPTIYQFSILNSQFSILNYFHG